MILIAGNLPGGVVLVGTVTFAVPTKFHPYNYRVSNKTITKYLQAIRVQAANPVDEQKLMRYTHTIYHLLTYILKQLTMCYNHSYSLSQQQPYYHQLLYKL